MSQANGHSGIGAQDEAPLDIDRTARWTCRSRNDGRIRVLCFPHAGGGASAFAGWQTHFPHGIEICPVQYPGRENRWGEPLLGNLAVLVQALADDLSGLWHQPFAFLGHSFGALVAFELTQALLREDHRPLRLFLSGTRAPHLPPRPAIHALPDAGFVEKLREFDGMSDELLHNAELMELALPIIRSDFRALETHRYSTGAPLPIAISVFGGLQDRSVPIPDLLAWSSLTSKAFRSRFFGGDHFFLYRSVDAIAGPIATDLAASAPQYAGVSNAEGVRHAK